MSATAEGEGQSSLEVHVWHEGYLHTVSMEPELVECLRRHHQDDTDCRPLLEEWEEQMTIFLWQLYSVTHVPVEYMRLVGMAQETVLCGEAEAAYLKELYRTVPAKHCHSFLLTLPDGGNEEFQASRRRHFASIVFEKFLHHPEIVALDSRRSFFGIIDDTRPLLSTSVKKDVDDELVRGLVVDAKEGDNSGSDTDFVRKCQQAADTIVEECSKIRFGSTPVVQPVYKVEMDNAGRKSPYLLCGACASTCLSPSLHASPMLVHEDNSFLNFGFVCQVSQLAQQHGDKGIMDLFGERSGEFVIEMEEARQVLWSRFLDQQRSLSSSYLQETELKLQNSHNSPHTMQSINDMHKRIQSVRSSVSLYEESYIQHKALTKMPLPELYHRASSFLSERLHEGEEADMIGYTPGLDTVNIYPLFFRFRLLKEITRWFKTSFFKWVNSPNCSSCEGKTVAIGGSAPETQEEKEGKAGIVEVYRCKSCTAITRFPRYNHPATLLDWRKGRCGEWANCFTQCCIAAGYESRYICDWTDHVWTEVWLPLLERWVHVDSCENSVDAPLTYETGWGKKLTYVIAVSPAECVDVTRRYTKKWNQVLKRRDQAIENWLAIFLFCFNLHVKGRFRCIDNVQGLPYALSSLDRHADRAGAPIILLRFFALRRMLEEIQLSLSVAVDLKARSREEQQGRISGSLEWRRQRNETGQHNDEDHSADALREDWFISKSCASESEWIQLHQNCTLGGPDGELIKELITFGTVLIGVVEAENRFVWGILPNLRPADARTPVDSQQRPQWRPLPIYGISVRTQTPVPRSSESTIARFVENHLTVDGVVDLLETLTRSCDSDTNLHLDTFSWPPRGLCIVSSAAGFSAELFTLLSDGSVWLLFPATAHLKSTSFYIGKTAWTAVKMGRCGVHVSSSSELAVEGINLTLTSANTQEGVSDIFSWTISVGVGTKKLQADVSSVVQCICDPSTSLPEKIEGTWQHSQDWRHTGVQQKSIYSKYFSLPFFAKDMPGFPILGLDPSSTTVGLRVPRHKGLSISTSNNQHSNVQMPSSIEALYVTARESSLECVIELIVENANLVHDSTNDRVTLLSWPFVVGDWIGLHRSGSRSEDTSLMGFSCLRKPMRKQECSSRSTDEIIEPLRQQVDLHSFLGNCVILFEELPRLQKYKDSESLELSLNSFVRDRNRYLEGTRLAINHENNTSTVSFSFIWPACRMASSSSPRELRLHRRTSESLKSKQADCVHAGSSTHPLYETLCVSDPFFLPTTKSEASGTATQSMVWAPLVRAPAQTNVISSTKTHLLARCSDDGTATEGEQEKWFAWKFPASFERMCHLAASASGNNL
eukprot:gb/GECG01013416.1/.p1 GENE.gb/GECG01013416.1/~~gb/GECG01013416.1/.p1  ORF type:complete len:1338 (+),score=147.29 gb/GECG01013416.1/:1-4014(+)